MFAGAAREVTGSCHIVRVNGKMVMLDCGLFQGRRAESDVKNRQIPLAVDQIDTIVLSHAHIDHAGRLPLLIREGYAKSIWATPATRDLSAIMLADSAHIKEKDAELLTRRNTRHILHHLVNGAADPRNTILIVGFMAEHTLGRRIVEKRPFMKVFGDEIPLRAQVEVLNGYSAHGDRTELRSWINRVRGADNRSLPVFLVHGETEAQDAFGSALREDGFTVTIPARGDRVHV